MRQLSDGFWNFRGSFKIAGVLDVGTQMSLVRRANGRFLVLDSYDLASEDRAELQALTDNGAAIDAILNVHPFHTLHCETVHKLFPEARLVGTRRHREQAPHLRWQDGVIEDAATQTEFAEDLAFSVPQGVDLVTQDPSVHAGSVLVRHLRSGIVHVDDTLSVLEAPGVLGKVLPQGRLRFHPMLGKALQQRAGAADAFTSWARQIAEEWSGTPYVCAAHSAVRELPETGWRHEVLHALEAAEKTLAKHRARHG